MLALALAAQGVAAQALFDYAGPDRMQKIAAAAKKEGTLTIYTTFAEKDQPALLGPFEAKYGVKVVVWRGGTDKVLQRTIRARRRGTARTVIVRCKTLSVPAPHHHLHAVLRLEGTEESGLVLFGEGGVDRQRASFFAAAAIFCIRSGPA